MPTITKKQQQTDLQDKLNSPYIVWLHNDDYNSFDHVINCMMTICGHELEVAQQIAHIVHFTGKCDAKRGSLEEMTKIYNKLKSNNLTVSMENA